VRTGATDGEKGDGEGQALGELVRLGAGQAARDRHAALGGGHVRIESIGTDRNTSRFDGWELAAARAAAVARAIQAGGLSEQRIMISIPEMNGIAGRDGQHIAIDLVPHG